MSFYLHCKSNAFKFGGQKGEEGFINDFGVLLTGGC